VFIRSRCCICGKAITDKFWVCTDCEKSHSLTGKYKSWPEWAKSLVNEEARRRYRRDHQPYPIPMNELSNSGDAVMERWLYSDIDDEED